MQERLLNVTKTGTTSSVYCYKNMKQMCGCCTLVTQIYFMNTSVTWRVVLIIYRNPE